MLVMPRHKFFSVNFFDNFSWVAPIKTNPSGKLLVTTLPAATTVLGPKTTPAIIIELEAIQQ